MQTCTSDMHTCTKIAHYRCIRETGGADDRRIFTQASTGTQDYSPDSISQLTPQFMHEDFSTREILLQLNSFRLLFVIAIAIIFCMKDANDQIPPPPLH